ncbi:diacylglycerol kinase [Psychrobacter sp. Pi2-1]|uniref:diacylglycerol kinase n=1 Tax=Psychrobacter sp. Pi2-1 TaxID=2774131 RepID=UPI00191A48E7|nr:diacylglycerol kinase [Psychrobacter sp. Pi2-1]
MKQITHTNLIEPSAEHSSVNQTAHDSPFAADSFASHAKGKTGILRIIKATGYSIDGFKAAYKFEAAFRQVVWLNLVLLAAVIVLPFALGIKMMLIVASFLSLIVELLNTGLEACVDHTSTARHPLAKIAKDVGSAAQFLALSLLMVLWVMALSALLY